MDQLVRMLAVNHAEWSFDSKHPVKKLDMTGNSCNSNPGHWETGRYTRPSWSSLSGKSQVPVRDRVPKNKVMAPESNTGD